MKPGKLLKPLLILMLILSVLAPLALADHSVTDGPVAESTASYSHRLIVQLASPSLAEWARSDVSASASPDLFVAGRLNVNSATAQAYIQQLQAEQGAFMVEMQRAIPGASVATYGDEAGFIHSAAYQIVMNGVAVDAGLDANVAQLQRALLRLPGVKAVYRDYAYEPLMDHSLPLINAAAAWDNPVIAGMENAGAGVKVASMDGGIHHAAPMFDGTGYEYPAGYPLGDTSNTNGKIIVSRAYFRTWDPPLPGDDNPWPGLFGTPHGVHTSSTAAGNPVTANYLGTEVDISGVAPAAYVMSYRMFYLSIGGRQSFYTVEGVAALEDIVADGADVVNNSWGGGPGSSGGEFDPIDNALINASLAGVFVSMSNGNAGPGLGTGDHPSADYINVAASTTDGTYASGRFNVSAPEPVPDELRGRSFAVATFGAPLPVGTVAGPFDYLPAGAVNPANVEGCNPWPEGTFAGKAAVISRGACEFGVKVLNAEQAGAELAVVYNTAAGGDALISMAPGAVGDQVTIPAIFVGRTTGVGVVDWYDEHGEEAQFEIDMQSFHIDTTPDLIANFSSRGPGVGNVLKPDIAAPGVSILAQGYAPGTTGEDRHLGFGIVSGTSMAAPHVSGAAALLKQIHPTWSNADIKSALMTTSKYLDVFNQNGSPAQPLDMGAGRLDLTNIADPGVILDPPSLSFGAVVSGTTASIDVTVRSVAESSETYEITTLYTGAGFDALSDLSGVSADPSSVTLAPGESAVVTVSWDTAASMGYGDNQGYVVMTSENYEAHMPAWMRVAYETKGADVLIIDNDFSDLLGFDDYTPVYATALESLGVTYEIWNADLRFNNPTTIPDANVLARYANIIYQTGDNFFPNGSFTVATPLTSLDMNRLVEYANNGGNLIVFGQDASWVIEDSFLLGGTLGTERLQDSITNEFLPWAPFSGPPGSPFAYMAFDLSGNGDGAGNQLWIDELDARGTCQPDSPEECQDLVRPLLRYGDPFFAVQDAVVALSHRQQPTLERPGVTFAGTAQFFAFGLEGVNNTTGYDTRQHLLGTALLWANDVAEVTILEGAEDIGAETVSVSHRWDFGDGSPITQAYEGNTGAHTYTEAGTYTVWVEATSALGTRVLGEYEVEISEDMAGKLTYFTAVMTSTLEVPTAPATELDAGPDATIDEGDTFESTGTWSAPDPSILLARVNYGDGSGNQNLALNADGTFDLSHTYTQEGEYTVTVTIFSAVTPAVTDTATVTVNNVAPVVNMPDDATIMAGETYTATAAFEDPGDDAWTATVDYGDGSGEQDLALNADMTFDLSHTYAAPGLYTITVTIDDGTDTGVGTTQVSVLETIVLPLLADTWVNGGIGEQNTNNNTFAALIARTTGLDNALLTFDRSTLPQGATIIAAELTVNVTGQTGAFGKSLTALNTGAFNTATVTYNNAPGTFNPSAAVAVPNTPGLVSFDVASQIAAWDALGAQAVTDAHLGQLAISAAGPLGRVIMDSLESFAGSPATLTITYRP